MSTDGSVVETAAQESWSGDYNETSNGSAMLRYALASRPETRTNRRKASIESSGSVMLLEGPSSGDFTKHIGFLQSQDTTGIVSQSSSNPFTQNPAKPLADLTEAHRSMNLPVPQRENAQSIPSSGSPPWNTNGELASVLLKLRAQPAPGSPQTQTGGGAKTRGRIPVESASPPTRKQSQSPTPHRVPQFIEPNLNAKSIHPAIRATAASKKSPGKIKSASTIPLRPEDENIPYFLRLATLQKENSDVTHISPSFITQNTAENSETQDSNSQRSDRYNPLPLTVEPTPPIARGGGLEISQTSTEGSQSSRWRSPPPGQGGVLVRGTQSSAPSTRSHRRSSPSADGFDLDITQTLDLGGNTSRPLSEFDPTQPMHILSDGDVDPDAPTQVLPSQPILRPYSDPRSQHAAPVLGLPVVVPLRKRPPTRHESISNQDTVTQELIRKPPLAQESSSFHLPGLEPTPPAFEPPAFEPPAFEPPHTIAEPSTPPSFPVPLPDLSPGVVPDSEDGRRAQSLDLNSDTEGEEVQPLKHKSYFPYVQTQDQDDDASVRVQASGQGTLPPTQPLMDSPLDLDAWAHESANTVQLPEPPSEKNRKKKDRAQTYPARKITRVMKEREEETSDEPEDENDEDYHVKPSDSRGIPVTRSGKKRTPRSQGAGSSPKRKRTVSKAKIPPIGSPVRRNTRQAQVTSAFATHGSSVSVDDTSGILVMYKSEQKFFAGWAVPVTASKWVIRPCDGSSSCKLNFSQIYRCEFAVGDEIDVLSDKTKRRESFGLATIVSIDDLSTKLWVRVKFRPKDAPDIVLNVSLAEVSLQGKPVKDDPRWKARLLRKGDLEQLRPRPVIFPLPVPPGQITPPPPTPVPAITNTRTASIAPGSKWLNGVGIIFTNLRSLGNDRHRYEELVQKHGGEVLQSWLSCFSFKGEIDETQTKWTSKNTDMVKWVGDRRAKTKTIKTMFVITGPPSHTPTLLIAMALGVPCIAPRWLDDCESAGYRVNWMPYKTASALFDHPVLKSGQPTQDLHPEWASGDDDGSLLREVMTRVHWRRFLKGYNSVLCIGEEIIRGLIADMSIAAVDPDSARCDDPYAYCLKACGAGQIEAVRAPEDAYDQTMRYDLIVISNTAHPRFVHHYTIPPQTVVVTRDVFKRSLSVGQLLVD